MMAKPMALDSPAGERADWIADMVEAIEAKARWARQHDTTFTADDMRSMIEPPPHPSWTGLAFRIARRRGSVEPVDWQISTVRSRGGGPVRVWKPVGP